MVEVLLCSVSPPLVPGVWSGSLHQCVQLSMSVYTAKTFVWPANVESELNISVLQGHISTERYNSYNQSNYSASVPSGLPFYRFIMLSHDRNEDKPNAIKVLDPSRLWFCSLHCSGWPIWEWWKLLLFWGPYHHGGRSTPSTQTDLLSPWEACAIRGTTWEKIGEGWGQGYLGSVFISLMSHVLHSDRQANWKLLSHKILHGSISPLNPFSQSKNRINNLQHRGDSWISVG